MRSIITTLSAITLALLSACGGGGDSGNSASTPTLAITAGNYQTVAVETVSTVNDMISASSLTTVLGASTSNTSGLVPVVVRKLPGWLAAATGGQPQLVGALIQVPMTCVGGGSASVSFNDANGNQLPDAGESMTATFNACVDAQSTLTGSLTILLNVFDINGSAMDLSISMSNFHMLAGGIEVVGNGSVRVASTRTGIDTGTDTISATNYSEANTVGGVTRTRSLMTFAARTDLAPAQSSTTFSGTFSSSALGADTLSFESTAPFLAAVANQFPHQGVARISGANSSKATLTVLDATNLRVDLDANGDGTVEQSVNLTWASML